MTIVCTFVALHDACRRNEYHDPEYGLRAAQWPATRCGSLLHFDNAAFALLELPS